MSWQDIVLFITQIVFCIALIPSIMSSHKPAFATSSVNTFFLFLLCYTYYTLNLTGAFAGTLITATFWLILAVQKYRLDKRSSK